MKEPKLPQYMSPWKSMILELNCTQLDHIIQYATWLKTEREEQAKILLEAIERRKNKCDQ